MIRQATKDEIGFYEKALYPLQDEILKLIKSDKFYLSGGNCLSRFYFDHRFSEESFNNFIKELIKRLLDNARST